VLLVADVVMFVALFVVVYLNPGPDRATRQAVTDCGARY